MRMRGIGRGKGKYWHVNAAFVNTILPILQTRQDYRELCSKFILSVRWTKCERENI